MKKIEEFDFSHILDPHITWISRWNLLPLGKIRVGQHIQIKPKVFNHAAKFAGPQLLLTGLAVKGWLPDLKGHLISLASAMFLIG